MYGALKGALMFEIRPMYVCALRARGSLFHELYPRGHGPHNYTNGQANLMGDVGFLGYP